MCALRAWHSPGLNIAVTDCWYLVFNKFNFLFVLCCIIENKVNNQWRVCTQLYVRYVKPCISIIIPEHSFAGGIFISASNSFKSQWSMVFFCRVANLPVSVQGRKAEYPVGTLATVLQSVFASMSTNAIESPTRS